MALSTKYTHADLLALPESNKRVEILDGELCVTPSPDLDHQDILLNLTDAFRAHLKAHPVGRIYAAPMDVILSEHDVLQPDLLFVRNERKNILKGWVRGAPDLALEILSPSTAKRDRGIKLKAYARFGVEEYWIVDPDQQAIEVYRLTPEGYELNKTFTRSETLTSTLLPGFSLPIASVFRI